MHFANVTRDSICVYLKLFPITDVNQGRLVRSRMSNTFKPNIRQALNQNTSDFSQVIFGSNSHVFKNLENEKMSILLKSVMLKTKKPGKAGKKPSTKGGKKPAAQGSKGKGNKNPKKKPKNGAKKNFYNSKDKEASKKD